MDSPETERDDPSRISEDAILDSLFYACDTEHSGRVPVSKLIDYLRNAISNGTEEFAGNLDDLSLMLDPDGRDIEIDLTSFQEGIKEWISEIRKRSYGNVEEDCGPLPSSPNCMDSSESRSYGSPTRISNHVTSTPNVTSESVEGLGGESPVKDWDRCSELTCVNTIENLQLNNKRLLEQHNAIQAQMESTEEVNSQLTVEVEGLRKQLRSYQLMIDKSKEKEKENAELRQAVSDALDANQSLQTKIAQLEKERALYESNLNEIEEKLLEAQGQMEVLEEEKRRLVHDLAEQKQYCNDLQEIQGVKNDMIAKESSTNSSMIVGLATENETLKMEKSRLENRILDLEENVLRLQRNELSAEKSQLFQNGPVLSSTPFARQSSLQQELEAQETYETKGLPSPMVGSQYNLNDSLDVNDLDTSPTGLNQSWMSSVSFESTSTNATFEKYSMTALQLANEFKEKKEKALRQIDELAALDRSVEVKDKKESSHNMPTDGNCATYSELLSQSKLLREQLTQELESFADKVSSLGIKKKFAEKRAMKLLAATKKLKDENKQLFEERSKAYQKLGTMSLCNDEMSARMLELEARLEQERKTVAQQREELGFFEQQLSAVTEDLFKTRNEKESLTRSLENEKRLSSSLEDELVTLRKSQDELESQQTLLLVRIKELESDLLKTTTQLSMEKRRTSALEESIQLSVSRHSDELKDIFDAIPCTDSEALNRSRQSPRASSPCITGHMVKLKLFDFVSHSDTSRRMQGVGRDAPDGKPVNELEEKNHPTYQEVSITQTAKEELAQTPLERWLDGDYHEPGPSSISSDSLSPKNGRQEVDGISESPSGKFLQLVENGERELRTSSSQTDVKDFFSIGSQTDLLRELEKVDLKDLMSTGSQTDLLSEIEEVDLKDLISTSSQTDLLRDIEELVIADKAIITGEDANGDRMNRRRKSGVSESPALEDRTIEKESRSDKENTLKPISDASDPGKKNLTVEKERRATSLWRKKLSVAFKTPDEFESYSSATGMALESSVGSSNFVDGVSLRVRPAPNEKEIEKQFRTLVLAFQTDQDTLSRRLEVQARARDTAESNMNRELQTMSNLLKEFEQLCITRDMQDMLALLKSQVDVMKTSSKRVSTQSEQHGCVQQEARMSSGVEIMICHAENLSRHLERVREDLNELRLKERLAADEPLTPTPLANGSTKLNSQRSESASASSHPGKPDTDPDGVKQNSLLNFVMAFHTTSMRAKDAIRSFRRRSGMGRQERSASAVPRLQADEPAAVDESTVESTSEGESQAIPVVVSETGEGKDDSMEEETEEGAIKEDDEQTKGELQDENLDELKESSENDSEVQVEELESQEGISLETLKRPGVCWRFFSAAFRFTLSFIIFMVILFVGLAIMDRHTSFKIDTYFILSKVRKVLEPVGQIIYNLKPPE